MRLWTHLLLELVSQRAPIAPLHDDLDLLSPHIRDQGSQVAGGVVASALAVLRRLHALHVPSPEPSLRCPAPHKHAMQLDDPLLAAHAPEHLHFHGGIRSPLGGEGDELAGELLPVALPRAGDHLAEAPSPELRAQRIVVSDNSWRVWGGGSCGQGVGGVAVRRGRLQARSVRRLHGAREAGAKGVEE